MRLTTVTAWRQCLGEASLGTTENFWRTNVLQQLQRPCETVEGLAGCWALMEVTHMGALLVGLHGDLFQT